jgi:uncharacterized membrane protein YdjX (TVP38/TMEM64 family)
MVALTGRALVFSPHHGQRFLAAVVFLTRLVPVLSFDLVSYAAGLSKQRVDYYAVATVAGMTPPTFLICSAGAQLDVGPGIGLIASLAAAALVVVLPMAIRRWNLFGLGQMVRLVKVQPEESETPNRPAP